MKERRYYIYIMTNKMNTTLYVGVTNSLDNRVYAHKTSKGSQFTKKYKLSKLIYYEEFRYINDGIAREKELKGWSSKKKEALIKQVNPLRDDLAIDWYEDL
ncbi:MAG: GIY-YIG nuclease family protein [Proteobacteria bacterium]|nr:GIY-YIG nuclease family protein [Pseudomonadota bacterium]